MPGRKIKMLPMRGKNTYGKYQFHEKTYFVQ